MFAFFQDNMKFFAAVIIIVALAYLTFLLFGSAPFDYIEKATGGVIHYHGDGSAHLHE